MNLWPKPPRVPGGERMAPAGRFASTTATGFAGTGIVRDPAGTRIGTTADGGAHYYATGAPINRTGPTDLYNATADLGSSGHTRRRTTMPMRGIRRIRWGAGGLAICLFMFLVAAIANYPGAVHVILAITAAVAVFAIARGWKEEASARRRKD